MTKVVGGLCGALLIFLLGNWGAELVYASGGGHGEEGEGAYVIEVAEAADSGEAAEEGPDFATVLASADVAKGAKVFGKCKACHKVEPGANATGPSLYGVVGRAVDAVDGFGYSGALAEVVDVWTPEHLSEFLANPKGYAPGTKMSFAGLKKIEDRANVVAYLDSLDD